MNHHALRKTTHQRGQATVEAAFLIPLFFVLALIMLQPGIILYDRMVMTDAALEGCRVLATQDSGDYDDAVGFISRRLSAIPQQDFFHVHEPTCTYNIQCTGGETSATVSVTISTQVKPLPFLAYASVLFGITTSEGNYLITVHHELQTQPTWVSSSTEGLNPSKWVS